MADVAVFLPTSERVLTARFEFQLSANTHLATYIGPGGISLQLPVSITLFDLSNRQVGRVVESRDPVGYFVYDRQSNLVGRIDLFCMFHFFVSDQYGTRWNYDGEVDSEGNVNQIHPQGNGVFIRRGKAKLENWGYADKSAYISALDKYVQTEVEKAHGGRSYYEYYYSYCPRIMRTSFRRMPCTSLPAPLPIFWAICVQPRLNRRAFWAGFSHKEVIWVASRVR